MKTSKYKVLVITLIALVSIGVYTILNARADSLTASLKVSPGCVSSVNGATSQTVNIVAGNTTLFVNNGDSIVGHVVSGPGVPAGTKVDRASRETNNEATISLGTVTAPTTITFTPIPTDYTNPGIADNNCPLGSAPSSSYLVINPVAAPAPAPTATTTTKKTTSPSSTTQNPTTTPAPSSTTAAEKETTKKEESEPETSNEVAESYQTTSNRTAVIVAAIFVLTVGAFITYLLKGNPTNKFLKSIKRKLK